MPRVFIPAERTAGEARVAATPETVKKLVKRGLEVEVERGAGQGAYLPDAGFADAGASLVDDRDAAWSRADIVLTVRAPEVDDAAKLREGTVLVGLIAPHRNLDLVRRLAAGKITTLALELVPRITRAQSMDVLSSQASIAGYRAVLVAASHLPSYFPLLMTAAGTVKPAKVVVMGAGVAGLQAVATARRLGAVVEVSDIRDVVKEQVESLGGHFIELPSTESGEGEGGYAREMGEDFLRRQREIVAEHVAAADVVLTTALIPGRPAPLLVPRAMVEGMRPGGVIVDLAIEQGGNCELSKADEEVMHQGVRILAPSNIVSGMSRDASTLLARNIETLLGEIFGEGEDGGVTVTIDREGNDVLAGTVLTHGGEVHHGPTAESLAQAGQSEGGN